MAYKCKEIIECPGYKCVECGSEKWEFSPYLWHGSTLLEEIVKHILFHPEEPKEANFYLNIKSKCSECNTSHLKYVFFLDGFCNFRSLPREGLLLKDFFKLFRKEEEEEENDAQ